MNSQSTDHPESEKQPTEYPLAYGQQSLLFYHQFYAKNSYNVGYAWKVKGKLDHELFLEALYKIQARHPILRTSFLQKGGQAQQLVHDRMDIRFELLQIDDD